MSRLNELKVASIELLKTLISTPSLSREEDLTATLIEQFLGDFGCETQRFLNNIWSHASPIDPNKKTILLNSHHDTVKPGQWQYDPFSPSLLGDRLIGLGSNDAGGSLVALLTVFLYLKEIDLPYNLVFAASAEEEISGTNGMRALYPKLGKIDLAIVGEPTNMDLAIAERGLIVADCKTQGKTGHAARNEGVNALYLAVDDINWIRSYEFEKVSEILGPVSMNVTKIESGTQHNVVPDECTYLMDIRTNELYINAEIIDFLKENLNAEFSPRSYWLNSSGIPLDHPLVKHAISKGFKTYGSPTLSDQSLMDCHSVKIGPGDSARSHTPNEYIYLSEIRDGIDRYLELLEGFGF